MNKWKRSKQVATARLVRGFERQVIHLPPGTTATRVKLDILETFGGNAATFVELEVREAPDVARSVLEGVEIDLARPAMGGAVVRYTGYGGDATASRLFDGEPTLWKSDGTYFPQDFTLAFDGDRKANVERVDIVLDPATDAKRFPATIAVALSAEHPLDGFVEVARVPIPAKPGTYSIPVNRSARYPKVRVLDNHGGNRTEIAGLSVIEAKDVQAALALTTATDAKEGQPGTAADLSEEEPNDGLQTANPLVLGRTIQGRIDPIGESDHFRLPVMDPDAAALTLRYAGTPNIRHSLTLLDEAGQQISHFDPGDLPAQEATLSFKLTGREKFLRLSEPPASVVVIWDTSGSMKGRETDLETAVRQYVQDAPPQQQLQLIRFSGDVETLSSRFTNDKSVLAAALNGKFAPNGGTRLYDAALEGLRLLRGRTGNRAIVLMTDGNDTSPTWLGELWHQLEKDRVRVYTIGIGDGLQEYSDKLASTGARMLGHLAQGSNGRSFFAANSEALVGFYASIAIELSDPAGYQLTPEVATGQGELELVAVGEDVPAAAVPAVHVIFDVSGSMTKALPAGGSRIKAAKEAMYRTLGPVEIEDSQIR